MGIAALIFTLLQLLLLITALNTDIPGVPKKPSFLNTGHNARKFIEMSSLTFRKFSQLSNGTKISLLAQELKTLWRFS